ncbi:MAG: Gfo/Idh/MocA family protein [Planctomycetaceae bacterium]
MQTPQLTGVLIGAGYFARFHAEAWRRISAVRIAAVVDSAPNRAQGFAQEFGIPSWYSSAERGLDFERPDFVDIVTRPESHLELTRLAATRRIHVICQKPMAPTMADCIAMVHACEAAGVRLLIHENWRWQPWYREIRRLIDEGGIGRLFQLTFQWRTADGRGAEPYPAQPYFRTMPRLLVYESLVHVLDTFRYLQGEIARVYCQNRRLNPIIAGEDQSLIAVMFESGALGLIDGNRVSGPELPGVAMGSLIVEGDGGVLRTSCDGQITLAGVGRPARAHDFAVPAEGYKGDSVRATQMHLIEALQCGSPSESDGRDYLKTVAAVFSCYESAETGKVVNLT